MFKKRTYLTPTHHRRAKVLWAPGRRMSFRPNRDLLVQTSAANGPARGSSTRASVTSISKRPTGRETFATSQSSRDESVPAPASQPANRMTPSQKRIVVLSWLAIAAMLGYALSLLIYFFGANYSFWDRAAALVWGLAIGHMLLHSIGYANSMLKASRGYDEIQSRVFSPQHSPKVACLVASFNEPSDVLEATLIALYAIDYPNKEIVILDDSTREETRHATRLLASRFGARVRQRTNRRGYKAGAINDFLLMTDAIYVAIFDADALPASNFLHDLVPIIDANPRLAFVQTPQFYSNTEVSEVARAAASQSAVFYEYICEGKSQSSAAFCCGTNVIFRREALLDLHGQDETTVSEDFATSLQLHFQNWDSLYYNQVYVRSLAPDTLSAYFTQQSRWSFGSIGVQRRVVTEFLRRPSALSPGQWWEYLLSSSYYWIGWVNFVFMLLPMLYIFGGVRPMHADTGTYLIIFVPYLLFTLNMFYTGMRERGYVVRDMLLAQQLSLLSFPYLMSAAIAGIAGRKRPFGVTPKGVGGYMSWRLLWPQLGMMALSAVTGVMGIVRFSQSATADGDGDAALVINGFWALFNALMLCGVFRLNRAPSQPFPSPAPERRLRQRRHVERRVQDIAIHALPFRDRRQAPRRVLKRRPASAMS